MSSSSKADRRSRFVAALAALVVLLAVAWAVGYSRPFAGSSYARGKGVAAAPSPLLPTQLGDAALFAGIPGEGPLTRDQIEAWLADESSHVPLKLELHPALRRQDERALPFPNDDNPFTLAKIELGRQLFFDPRLSDSGTLSCSDCHHPLRYFSADLIGHERLREPPVVFNRIFGPRQFWDGRADSLEHQPRFAIENPDELNSTVEAAVGRIAAIEGYRLQFDRIFGRLDIDTLSQAIAAFERAVVTAPTSWDFHAAKEATSAKDSQLITEEDVRFILAADKVLEQAPLTDEQRLGTGLFFSHRLGCSRCHSGPNFSDEEFHNVGSATLPPVDLSTGKPVIRPRRDFDPGRMAVTGDPADRGKFKTPTLRNVTRTPPYMHDGRFLSLEAAVDFFLRGGDEPHHDASTEPNASESELTPVDLTPKERSALLAFLKALESPPPNVSEPRLPEKAK